MFIYHRCFAISESPSPKWLKIIFRTIASHRCTKEGGRKCLENTWCVYIYICSLIGNCSSGGSSNHEARNAPPVRNLFSLYFPPFSTSFHISNKGAPFCRRKSTNGESWRKMKSNFSVFFFYSPLGRRRVRRKEEKRKASNENERTNELS